MPITPGVFSCLIVDVPEGGKFRDVIVRSEATWQSPAPQRRVEISRT